jgi:hypothetical protein
MIAVLTNAAPSIPFLPDAKTGLDPITPDPHLLPVFTPSDVISPSAPILYLPPLLSSPPDSLAYKPPPVDSLFQPLVTETRLPDIDPASLSLHKALHKFQPLTAKYAETPYEEAFNWSELSLPEDDEREWYCVVFRSKRKTDSNSERKSTSFLHLFLDGLLDSIVLYEADKLAHEEAVRNGGVSYRQSVSPAIRYSHASVDPLLVWHPKQHNWHEPCDVHLAKSQTCHCRECSISSHQGNEVSCRVL